MKIENLHAQSFLGLSEIDVYPDAPIVFFAGRNKSGKSSIIDAIRFALLGTPLRVRLKQDVKQLGNGPDGVVSVQCDGNRITRPTSGEKAAGALEVPAALPFVLDAQQFAVMGVKERRTFLIGLSGVKMSVDDVFARAVALGCGETTLEVLRPMFRAGFDAVSADAARRATGAKGSWRAITGEIWGSKKAESWSSVTVAPGGDVDGLSNKLGLLDTEISHMLERIGEAKAGKKAHDRAADLRTRVAMIPEKMEAVATAFKNLATTQEKVNQLSALAAQGGGMILNYVCRHCGVEDRLIISQGKITPAPDEVQDPAATGAVSLAKADLAQAKHLHAQYTASLAEAQAAQKILAKMELPGEKKNYFDLESRVQQLQEERAQVQGDIQKMAAARRDHDAAVSNTGHARKYHEEITEWLKIAEVFSATGIPAEMTSQAVKPIRDHVTKMAIALGWDCPSIGFDMAITVEGRNYMLLSESEKWRVDTLFGEAIAYLSGLRLLVLDRISVLDIESRAPFMKWIYGIRGDYDSIWMAGTLKALPAMPPGMCGYWLDDGKVAISPTETRKIKPVA